MRNPLESRRAEMRANLLRRYALASESDMVTGRAWYGTARDIIDDWARAYHVSRETAACVTAAISPQCEWTRNLIIADDILAGRNPSVGGSLPRNVDKARAILGTMGDRSFDVQQVMSTAFPAGPKVNAFARNLAGDESAVTVDTHAAQAAVNDPTAFTNGVKPAVYRIIAEVYQAAAAEVGITPAQFQAVIWTAWKRLYPRESKKAAMRLKQREAEQ